MSEVLQSLSDALAGTVENTSPGIVRVDGRRRLAGTGIVWSNDGLIVTAHHIVERNENITIGLKDGLTAPATLVGRDPNTDLAVLRVEADLTPPNWSDADDLKIGHLVLALGRPGEDVQATLGVVSMLHEEGSGRRKRRSHRRMTPLIQTDVVMYPGFSGGPLVDAGGFVRGLNTSGLSRSSSSLTVPTATIRSVVESLLSHGKVRRGYLGIGAQPVRLAPALSEQMQQEIGLMLVSIEAGSPAEHSGLLQGDILVALDGEAVQVIDELLLALSDDKVGQEVTLTIVRGGEVRDVAVTVGERE